MTLAIEDFRPEHRLLHFGALFFGSVLVDHAQCASIHVNFNRGPRACVRSAAVNWRAHFVLVSESREYAGLANVDR